MLYAHGLDHRDFDLAESVFDPDCYVHGTVAAGPMADYWPKIRKRVEEYARTMHVMSNVLIEEDADGRASVETYCVAYHLEPLAGGPPWIVAVRYMDLVAETASRWKISERRVERFWERDEL
jgi:hypothetical protein